MEHCRALDGSQQPSKRGAPVVGVGHGGGVRNQGGPETHGGAEEAVEGGVMRIVSEQRYGC